MEHELGVEGEVVGQYEAIRIRGHKVPVLLAETYQHLVQPLQHVRILVHLRLVHCHTRHQNSTRLLVESALDELRMLLRVHEVAPGGGDTDVAGPVSRGVAGYELDQTHAVGRGLVPLGGDLEEHRQSGGRIDGTYVPASCPAYSNLVVRDLPLLVARDTGPNGAHNLQLPHCLNLDRGVERHPELGGSLSGGEHLLEGLSEERGVEVVAHHQVAAGAVGERLHLEHTGLVLEAGEDVHGYARGRPALGQSIIELGRLPRVPRLVLPEVVVGADRLLQLVIHHVSGPHGAGPPREQHQAAAHPRVGCLQQRQPHGEGGPGAADRTLALRDGPRVRLQLVDEVAEGAVAVLAGLEVLGEEGGPLHARLTVTGAE